MKILYDHQIFDMQISGGASRYFSSLLINLKQNFNIDVKLPIKKNLNLYIEDFLILNSKDYKTSVFKKIFFNSIDKNLLTYRIFKKLKFDNKIFKENKKNSIKLLEEQNYDIFHPTYYNNYFLDYIGGKPFVITIYDMIHEIYPNYYELYDETHLLKQKLYKKAVKIFTISKNTKKDIINFYKVKEEQIEVIYPSNSLQINLLKNDVIFEKFKKYLPLKYLLYIGDRTRYKNFYFFVRTVSSMLRESDIFIVCIGKSFTKEEIKLFEDLDIKKKMISFFVSDNLLPFIYANAISLVFPSLYEGFGIPVLEAFACNCPVIASNSSSFPEVVGDAGILFDIDMKDQLLNAINRIIFEKDLRQELILKGKKQLAKFSWERSAEKLFSCYKKILS